MQTDTTNERVRVVTPEELAAPVRPYRDVLDEILSSACVLPPVRRPLLSCAGLLTARALTSEHDVPAFASSALDGFAVRAIDVQTANAERPVKLRVRGGVQAGHVDMQAPLLEGEARAIATGAPIPEGADAIVPWENTDVAAGALATESVLVTAPASTGAIRPIAEDVTRGEELVPAGALLGPLQLGSLAAAGVGYVDVIPAPRIAVLSTGDELVSPGEPLRDAQRHDANSTIIAALGRAFGAEVGTVGALPDDPDTIAEWLVEAAQSHDLIIASGGASVGRHDWMRHVIEANGQLRAWRAAIKPGKPIAFGSVYDTPIFALPGNPASVAVAMHVFVAPYIRSLAGQPPMADVTTRALGADVSGDAARVCFCPVRLDGDRAIPLPMRSSQVISTFAAADALAEIPMGGASTDERIVVHTLRTGVC